MQKRDVTTKPEVHDVLHYCQRSTEPRPWVIGTENLVKFERACGLQAMWADKQTYRHADHYISHPYQGPSKNLRQVPKRKAWVITEQIFTCQCPSCWPTIRVINHGSHLFPSPSLDSQSKGLAHFVYVNTHTASNFKDIWQTKPWLFVSINSSNNIRTERTFATPCWCHG